MLEITLMSVEGAGTEMVTSAAAKRRELAHRTGKGIEVTLFWTESTNAQRHTMTYPSGPRY